MAYDTESGQINIRSSYFDKVVKGIAAASYKFKQAVTIIPTSAWKNFFYRENTAVLTGQTGNDVKGIPRGAEFPNAVPQWERISSTIEKYGLETTIAWEDILTDDVDVRDRSLIKIAEGVAKSVDDTIWAALTGETTIQSFTIGKSSASSTSGSWDESSAAIIDDLLQAAQKIAEYNYSTDNLMVFVSPRDKRSIMRYLADKGAQFPSIAQNVASNGKIMNLAGIDIIESNSVTASQALVVVPKRCATWKELVGLQTTTKEDAYKSLTIRAVEMGITQVTDPKAIVWIKGTLK